MKKTLDSKAKENPLNIFANGLLKTTPFDLFDDILARAFEYSKRLSDVPSSVATMSQKRSLIKLPYLDP